MKEKPRNAALMASPSPSPSPLFFSRPPSPSLAHSLIKHTVLCRSRRGYVEDEGRRGRQRRRLGKEDRLCENLW